MSNVAQVVPDEQVTETVPLTAAASNVAPGPGSAPPTRTSQWSSPRRSQTCTSRAPGADEADRIADGNGVIVAIDGMNELAGNPNFTRPNGQHVVEDAPDYNPDDIPNDPSLDEWFGDASSVAAQGTVTYQYASELPFSNMPHGLHVRAQGRCSRVDARRPVAGRPGGDGQQPTASQVATVSQSESSIIAGMENAVATSTPT